MVIRILDHVRTASSYKDGEKIFAIINREMSAGNDVVVSFEGIGAVPSAFVNSALVRLLETQPFDGIRQRISFVHTTKHINQLIRERFAFACVREAGSSRKQLA